MNQNLGISRWFSSAPTPPPPLEPTTANSSTPLPNVPVTRKIEFRLS